MKNKKIIGFIFARGGSKGIPGKNIRLLDGKPLIAHAIETGLGSKFIKRMIVSTDDPAIAETARNCGAETPFMRPPELAGDKSPEWLAWRHALKELEKAGEKVDVFVSLPATAPLRSVRDVDACIELFLEGGADAVITAKNASRHPAFNMITLDKDENAQLVMPPDKTITRRQDAPAVYDMTTVAYILRPDFILRADAIFQGRVKAVLVPDERALDIDTELDFAFAEFLTARKRK